MESCFFAWFLSPAKLHSLLYDDSFHELEKEVSVFPHSAAQQQVFADSKERCQAEKSTEMWVLSVLESSTPLLLWAVSSSHDCITKKKLVTITFHDKSSHVNLDGIYLAQIQAHKVLSEVRQN